MVRVVKDLEERNVSVERKNLRQGVISAKDLTTQLPDGCESLYHRVE